MTRLPDWRERLFAFIESRREMEFSWGSNDCAIFCADCVQAITGEDLAAQWRGSYSDEAGALKILAGFGSLEALATAMLGDPTGPLCARQGDIALLSGPKGPVLGVVVGHEAAYVGDKEQILLSLAKAEKCWRVG